MPLIQKTIANSTRRWINYIACCPCIWTLAVCCVAVCQCATASTLAFSPCNDDPLKETANTIVNRALCYLSLESAHPNLLALSTDTWNPSKAYESQQQLNDNNRQLSEALETSLYTLLNTHDVGTIKSAQLTVSEIQVISEHLRDAIFGNLPNKQVFFEQAQQAAIDTSNKGVLDDFLAEKMAAIIQRDFIKQQLDNVSDQLVTQRLYQNVRLDHSQSHLHSALIAEKPPSYSTGLHPALSPTTPAVPPPLPQQERKTTSPPYQ